MAGRSAFPYLNKGAGMGISRQISRQLSDLLVYLLIPAIAVITPASFSRWLLRRVSRWSWLLGEFASAACDGASKHLEIDDEEEWKNKWRLVELLDFRDLYMMLCGRSAAVLAEIESPTTIEIAKDRVMVGMHWGPAISILKMLAAADLHPAFPFRGPEKKLLRVRPFYYFASSLAARYLSTTLGDRAVPVGGAGKVLQALLDQPGTLCVLMDAPTMHGRRTLRQPVLGVNAEFNSGFPKIIADKNKEYLLYAMNLSADGSARKQLDLEGPYRSESADDFLTNYAAFMERHLSTDSSTWRFWQVEEPFWYDRSKVGAKRNQGHQ
jgi:hypothetical protein